MITTKLGKQVCAVTSIMTEIGSACLMGALAGIAAPSVAGASVLYLVKKACIGVCTYGAGVKLAKVSKEGIAETIENAEHILADPNRTTIIL